MRELRGRSIMMRLRRLGESRLARAALAICLAQVGVVFITVPAHLGVVTCFALACLSAALTILILWSFLGDDLRLRRVAAQLRDVGHHLSPVGRSEAGGGQIGSIERSIQEIGGLVASIEQRLLHRHPVSGLPTREPLFEQMAGSADGLLGVIHLTDLERLLAFDEALAEHVLVTLTERISRMLGAGTMVAQVDRARLAIWFGPETPHEAASTKLEAVGYALGEAMLVDGRELLPNIRITRARMEAGMTPAVLLGRASVASDGPTSGPAYVKGEAADPLAAVQDRYALEQDLRRAIERGELALAYQPLIDAEAGAVCGAEALLRWRHPVRGLVPPTRFVPIMEAAGLADEIGLWAINTACREAAAWKRTGLGSLRVAVNISGRQLERGDLATLIGRTMARHSLSSDMLEIELTETIATGDADRVADLFGQLRRLGVALAIDDFGTGYSSFSTLRMLRFDKLKIDREFVTAVDARRDSQAICRAILALGQGMGMRVLAEGVETTAEYGWLRSQGCRYFQGYYFAKPLEPNAFRAFAREVPRLAELLAPTILDLPERLRA